VRYYDAVVSVLQKNPENRRAPVLYKLLETRGEIFLKTYFLQEKKNTRDYLKKTLRRESEDNERSQKSKKEENSRLLTTPLPIHNRIKI